MKKAIAILLIISLASCSTHHKRKEAKMHCYTTYDANNQLLYWYILFGQNNNSYYYYSSSTPVTDFSTVNFNVSNEMPVDVSTATALPEIEVGLDGLPESMQEGTQGIDVQETEVNDNGTPVENESAPSEPDNSSPSESSPSNDGGSSDAGSSSSSNE